MTRVNQKVVQQSISYWHAEYATKLLQPYFSICLKQILFFSAEWYRIKVRLNKGNVLKGFVYFATLTGGRTH